MKLFFKYSLFSKKFKITIYRYKEYVYLNYYCRVKEKFRWF